MNCFSLRDVSFMVLDEADRVLYMGFEKDVRRILGTCCAPQTQTSHSMKTHVTGLWGHACPVDQVLDQLAAVFLVVCVSAIRRQRLISLCFSRTLAAPLSCVEIFWCLYVDIIEYKLSVCDNPCDHSCFESQRSVCKHYQKKIFGIRYCP